MSKDRSVEGSSQKKGKKTYSLGERIRAGLFLLVFGAPFVYGILAITFSTPFNNVFNYEKTCTISWASKGVSRSKSSSGSYYIYIESPDCGGMRYKGPRHGLTLEEVADRIDELSGQTLTVHVGYWQLLGPGDMWISGIEGLDLSK